MNQVQELQNAIDQRNQSLNGEHLPGDTLHEVVNSDKMIILHFLRHLGCAFCKHSVEQLRAVKEASPNFPTIVFVHQSEPEEGEKFFQQRFPGAPHIADPKLELYKLFGIRSMNPARAFNPKMWLKGLKITLQGYSNKVVTPDNTFILSGTFLFNNGKLVWQHRAQFAGDDPKWERLQKLQSPAAQAKKAVKEERAEEDAPTETAEA